MIFQIIHRMACSSYRAHAVLIACFIASRSCFHPPSRAGRYSTGSFYKAIEEARERDRLEQEKCQKKIKALANQLQSSRQMPVDQVSPPLQNIQSLIEEAASIGGEVLNKIPNLETIEDSLIQ